MWERLTEALNITLVGMTGVFVVLSFFSFVIWALKKTDESLYQRKLKSQKKAVAKEKSTVVIDDELIAIISAAAIATLKKRVVVKKIFFLDSTHDESSWTLSGRNTIMASHSITKKR